MKQNYQNFEEDRETQMGSYSDNVPVGQPVSGYVQRGQMPGHYQSNGNPNYNGGQQMYYPGPHMPPPPPPPAMLMPPIATSAQNFNYPTNMTCPCCKMSVATVVNAESGNTTYLWCATLFCFCFPFCPVPFLMDSCLDKSHYCPNCGHNILRKHQKCFEWLGC